MRIETLSFNSGPKLGSAPLRLEPGKITIFVGPNNGGKSAALREIAGMLQEGRVSGSGVFENITHSRIDDDEFDAKLKILTSSNEVARTKGFARVVWRGNAQEINVESTRDALRGQRVLMADFAYNYFLSHFSLNLDGVNRLNLVAHALNQNLRAAPNSSIAAIFKDDVLRDKISEIVYEAFDLYLTIDPTHTGILKYALSKTKPAPELERSFSDPAIEFFEGSISVEQSSDGTKAFIGILTEIMAGAHDVLLIDEPEAFLHPGLAFLLGQKIAKHAEAEKQLFVATHSPDFLMGCISAGVPIDIVRLTYRSGEATARLLPSSQLQSILNDPLMRSIGVISALFYQSAVVVEADADRAFYQEINNRLHLHGEKGIRHAVFLNAHNKQGATAIARVLRQVGVPAAFVLDIDWIKEEGEVCKRYLSSAGLPSGLRSGFAETRRQVRSTLDKAEQDYKRKGGIQLLEGDERVTAEAFFEEAAKYGLFTVSNGELESWLAHLGVSRNKGTWLSSIFQKMGANPTETDYSKPTGDDVWEFLRSIGEWTRDSNRRGLDSV